MRLAIQIQQPLGPLAEPRGFLYCRGKLFLPVQCNPKQPFGPFVVIRFRKCVNLNKLRVFAPQIDYV